MLAHRDVNYSTFPVALAPPGCSGGPGRRLHSVPMRIELPTPSWADAQRAHDDAHTLTVPAQHPPALPHPLPGAWTAGEAAASRVEVPAARPPALTLTF